VNNLPNTDVLLSAKQLGRSYQLKKAGGNTVFRALNNISFDLRRGQILGIIGPNGAGKSTLLKILAEVIPPSDGEVHVYGSTLSILDIGTGFHPELSGYENIFFNAALLGMNSKQVKARIEDIVEFSGIREFIHQPIKNYSSGMYLRLALSVALFMDNDILLLDEVVSVGDAEFRQKALERVKLLVASGKACILISHDLNSVLSLCNACLLLEKGEIVFRGESAEAIETYLTQVTTKVKAGRTDTTDHSDCRFISAQVTKSSYAMNESPEIVVNYEKKVHGNIDLRIKLHHLHYPVLSDSNAFRQNYSSTHSPPGLYQATCRIPANLLSAGNYHVDVTLGDQQLAFVDVKDACQFSIALPEWEKTKKWGDSAEFIPLRPVCEWRIEPLKHQ